MPFKTSLQDHHIILYMQQHQQTTRDRYHVDYTQLLASRKAL